MSIISLLIVLIVIGVILWLLNTYIPMDPKIKQILNVVVIILVILWILNLVLGGIGHLGDIRIGR